jgi:hypothetical protein
MSLQRARSVKEYIEWVQQAVFEVDDLRACLEYDSEDLAQFPAFLAPLDVGIKALYQAMQEGNYHFGRDDLPFIDLATHYADDIPFCTLLKQINETHQRGLDIENSGDAA